jgi:hypothetical protein
VVSPAFQRFGIIYFLIYLKKKKKEKRKKKKTNTMMGAYMPFLHLSSVQSPLHRAKAHVMKKKASHRYRLEISKFSQKFNSTALII